MTDLLERIEHQLVDARVAPPDLANIMFALTASLDESISQSSWNRKAEWVAAPLCFDRFNRLDGGEEFFARLAAVQSTKPMSSDVLQIYFLCLTLGFKGRYLLRSDEDRHELVSEVGSMVRNSADQPATALGPHGMPGELIAEIVREIPVWVFAVTGLGLAALIYFALTLMINWRADALEQLIR
jgi:type VI secretion system protein ImpK